MAEVEELTWTYFVPYLWRVFTAQAVEMSISQGTRKANSRTQGPQLHRSPFPPLFVLSLCWLVVPLFVPLPIPLLIPLSHLV